MERKRNDGIRIRTFIKYSCGGITLFFGCVLCSLTLSIYLYIYLFLFIYSSVRSNYARNVESLFPSLLPLRVIST